MEIDKSIDYPDSVFKFYDLTEYNVEALIDQYLYLNTPPQLNDGMDASCDLLYMNDIKTIGSYNRIVENIRKKVPQLVNYKLSFSADKECKELKRALYDACFDFNGIISFTASKKSFFNGTMWGHYAKNKGFAIEFVTTDLIEGIKGDLRNKKFESLICKEIEYYNELKAMNCDITYDIDKIDIGIVFQKQIDWKNEKEWRMFVKSNQYLNNTYGRHLFYSIKAIKRICLGDKFWEEISINKKNVKGYIWKCIVKEEYMPLVIKLKELKDKIYMNAICYAGEYKIKGDKWIHTPLPTRSFGPIVIEKIENNEIEVELPNEGYITEYNEFPNN